MRNRLIALACGALGAVVAAAIIIVFITPVFSVNAIDLACDGECPDADAIQIAMELGRLDIVSLVLAFLGLIIAVLAIFGFLAIREKAALQAKDAAEKAVKEWLQEGEGAKVLQKNIGLEFSKFLKLFEEQMPDINAVNIANAYNQEYGQSGGEE
ncbi:MAG: hypothetical protein CMP91_02375 [Gammaproteobacteria bacterium]|nr:hypothetical protein [Gammaproteobacteria bacterium]|tara:strand:+ start:141439 stop:141903 length:465 start_codon:yes stop_codon:yes gene_type:complete